MWLLYPFASTFHYQLEKFILRVIYRLINTESDREHVLWEQGDSDISTHSNSLLIE